jgi:subtilisin family serine protease
MFRPMAAAGLCMVLVVAGCDGPADVLVPEEEPVAAVQDRVLGEGVLEAIRRGESPRVMIALGVPVAATMGALRSNVATIQSQVLQGFADSDIAIERKYVAVPAVSLTVRNEAALRRLAGDPNVRRIDLDAGGTGSLALSTATIGADQRHAAGNDGEGVVVAVLDTGIDTDHADLVDDVGPQACFGDRNGGLDGIGFCPNGSDRQTGPGAAEDDAGHGTHVAGIITARGTLSAPGVAPGAEIVALKVLDGCSFSGCFSFFSEIVAALDYIIANNGTLGVQLINMSLGTSAQFEGACDDATAFTMAGAAAINTLRDMGVLAFASAGNNGSGTTMPAPACLSNVIAVGATDDADNVAGFSQSNLATDVFAPGVSVASLSRFGGTTAASGTSMASPHAVGCAALLIDAADATLPDALEARLETSSVQVTDATNGLTFPRIDCSPDSGPAPVHAAVMDVSPSTVSMTRTTTLHAALLSSSDFDATAVALDNVRMLVNGTREVSPARRRGSVISSTRDWNSDGLTDRVISFRVYDLVAAGLTTTATGLVLHDRLSTAQWRATDPSGPTIVYRWNTSNQTGGIIAGTGAGR